MAHPAEDPGHRRLRRFALAAIATNVLIVVTGGLVRVTGSGLGCPSWPNCSPGSLVPTSDGGHAGWQAAIEFGNRLMSFVVLAAAVAVWVQVRRTRPHPRAVEVLAWILPLGVVAQAIKGGITVLTGLSPWSVAIHFLLSMGLIAAAVGLHESIRPRDPAPPAGAGLRRATTVLAAVAFAVLMLGTVVTGSGPHGGDVGAARFPLHIRTMAIAHADAVWLLLGLTVALVALTWRSGPPRLRIALRTLLVVELAQGTVGYTQYVLGIPEALVAVHILGAAVLWTATSAVWFRAHPLHAHGDAEVAAADARPADAAGEFDPR